MFDPPQKGRFGGFGGPGTPPGPPRDPNLGVPGTPPTPRSGVRARGPHLDPPDPQIRGPTPDPRSDPQIRFLGGGFLFLDFLGGVFFEIIFFS